MKYRPEDFRGLSEEECALMKYRGLSREDFDHFQKMMAYGHCCQAVHHLELARVWLDIHAPKTGQRLARLTRDLADAFLPKTEKPKTLKST